MTRAEAQSVRNAEDPMGQLIVILLGKGDTEFNTFCDMLNKSNHHGWANNLRLEAKTNRQMKGENAAYSLYVECSGMCKLTYAYFKALNNLLVYANYCCGL